ncbi:hypothetical protein V2J09_005841 [Rumex salicifolius]
MTKVFPNSTFPATKAGGSGAWNMAGVGIGGGDPVVLTVWKKSLLMNCNGFTVYDGRGNLVYRVDNYVAGNRGEIVLMDAGGKPLLTIRRKRSSFGDSWMVYDGEKTVDPRFSFRRNVNFRNSKTLGQVTSGNAATSSSSPTSSPSKFYSPSSPRKNVVYEIEGSYSQRSVSVYDNSRRCVAEIKPKQTAGGVALGVDVFRLITSRPYMETSTAMALVILIDQIFGSSSYSGKRHCP